MCQSAPSKLGLVLGSELVSCQRVILQSIVGQDLSKSDDKKNHITIGEVSGLDQERHRDLLGEILTIQGVICR